jgi:hypothetical protein
VVCNEEQPDASLDTFMKLLIPVTNKHYETKIHFMKNDSKKIWGTLNDIFGKKSQLGSIIH